MVLLSQVRALLNLAPAASGDDALISEAMQVALAYVAAETNLSVASSGDNFEEWFNGDLWEFTLKVRANDIAVSSVTAYDGDGVASTIATTDYAKLGPRTWRFLYKSNEMVRVKVIYSSNYGMRAINSIIADVAIWEFSKMPNKTGKFDKTASVVGQNNISYKTDADFYAEINRRIDKIVLNGL